MDRAPDALHVWFEEQGLTRRQVEYSEVGGLREVARDPLIALGPADTDFVRAPLPACCDWPGSPLEQMDLDGYNVFIFRWLEAAVRQGLIRCAHCGKLILDGDDLPDPDTWDAIFIEKELVAWMLVHFDCKRWLAKKLKGMHPFELSAGEPPRIDLAALSLDETERPPDAGPEQ